jgi:uncharacterized membrane protein YheB (UPF0754 family)
MTATKQSALLIFFMFMLVAAALLFEGVFKVMALGGLFGGTIGWATNWGVIRMLFRPREPLSFLGYTWSGLLVKKKPELAKKIGEVVEENLLTTEKILSKVDGIKPLIHKNIEQRFINITQKDLGTIPEVAGNKFLPVVNDARVKMIAEFSPVIEKMVFSVQSVEWLTLQIIKMLRYYAETPLVYVVGTERIDKLLKLGLEKFGSMDETKREEKLSEIYSYFYDQAVLQSMDIELNLKSILKENPPQFLEQVSSDVLNFISDWIDKPENQKVVRNNIKPLLEKIAVELSASNPLISMFIDIKRKIEEGIDEHWESILVIIKENLRKREPQFYVQDKIKELFPVMVEKADIAGFIEGYSFNRIYEDICRYMSKVVVESSGSAELYEKLRVKSYVLLEKRVCDLFPDWKDILGKMITETFESYVGMLGSNERASIGKFLETVSEKAINEIRIGRLDRKISEANIEMAVSQITEIVYCWIKENLPDILENDIKIGEMVEEEINGFSSEELEKTVKSVTEEELGTIIRMGGYLGILAGSISQFIIFFI